MHSPRVLSISKGRLLSKLNAGMNGLKSSQIKSSQYQLELDMEVRFIQHWNCTIHTIIVCKLP